MTQSRLGILCVVVLSAGALTPFLSSMLETTRTSAPTQVPASNSDLRRPPLSVNARSFSDAMVRRAGFDEEKDKGRIIRIPPEPESGVDAKPIEFYAAAHRNPDLGMDARSEFAGVLADAGRYDRAREILVSSEPSGDDRFLLASIDISLGEYDEARKLLTDLVEEKATLRARLELAQLHAWTRDYERAIACYDNILADYPDGLAASIGLIETLVWNKQFARAHSLGKKLLPQLAAENELRVWIPMLQVVSEVALIDQEDRDFVAHVFSQRSKYSGHLEFTHSLAQALMGLEWFSHVVEVLTSLEQLDHARQYQLSIALTQLGRDDEAARILDRLLAEHAFADLKQRRGELWLVAASNRGRLGSTDEMSTRYTYALPIWRQLIRDQPDNATLWPRYLDAAAGSKKLNDIDVKLTLGIFKRFEHHAFLTQNIEFMTRLIDVMIRLEQAEQVLPKSIWLFEQHPEDVDVRLRLANNLHAVARFAEADTHYDFLIDNFAFEDDNAVRGQMMISAARNKASMSDFQASRDLFELMWRLGLRTRDFEIEYAVILAKTGDEGEAGRLLDRESLTLTQKSRLAATYASVQEFREAAKLYEEILAVQPDDVVTRRRWAKCLVWLKRYDQAIVVLGDLMRDNDQDLELRCLLAQAKLWSGQHSEALDLLSELIDEIDPGSFHLQPEYAAALLFNDQPREALVWMNGRPNLTPEGQYLLGAIYSQLGEFPSAADVYRQIIRDHPDDRRAHRMLADVSAWNRDYDNAIRLYHQLLQETPEDEALWR